MKFNPQMNIINKITNRQDKSYNNQKNFNKMKKKKYFYNFNSYTIKIQ